MGEFGPFGVACAQGRLSSYGQAHQRSSPILACDLMELSLAKSAKSVQSLRRRTDVSSSVVAVLVLPLGIQAQPTEGQFEGH